MINLIIVRVESSKKYKRLKVNLKNVFIYFKIFYLVSNKSFRPPDLSAFKDRMSQSLKNKQSAIH